MSNTLGSTNDALSVFLRLYPAAVEITTIISSSTGWNTDSSSRAFSFLNNITSFSFISTFVLICNILAYTAPLATALQVKAYEMVKVVSDTIQNVGTTLMSIMENGSKRQAT